MGLPLLLAHRLRVDVHGRADIRMPQEFLLDLQVFPIRPEQGGESVAERVPPDIPEVPQPSMAPCSTR